MRIGLIGCGRWGQNIVRNLHDMGVLVAIYDQDSKALDRVRFKYPYARFPKSAAELMHHSEIDGVVIATNAESHYGLTMLALAAELDVLVEKPMALHSADIRELIAQAEKLDRVLMAGHVFLYNLAVEKLVELMPHIGSIQYVYSQRLATFPPREYVGVLLDLAIHDVYILQYLFGTRGTTAGWPAKTLFNLAGSADEDFASFTMDFDGIPAHITVSWAYPEKIRKMVIVGKEKTLVWDDTAQEFKIEIHESDLGGRFLIGLPNAEPLRVELEHFATCIESRDTPLTDGYSALRALEALGL